MQQYSIAVKESRGQLSYLPAGRTKFIRAKHLGDKFDKAAVLSTLRLDVDQLPDGILLELRLGFAFGVCLQRGKYCCLIELVTEMFRSDKLRSCAKVPDCTRLICSTARKSA